jgi:hypothetical protein
MKKRQLWLNYKKDKKDIETIILEKSVRFRFLYKYHNHIHQNDLFQLCNFMSSREDVFYESIFHNNFRNEKKLI